MKLVQAQDFLFSLFFISCRLKLFLLLLLSLFCSPSYKVYFQFYSCLYFQIGFLTFSALRLCTVPLFCYRHLAANKAANWNFHPLEIFNFNWSWMLRDDIRVFTYLLASTCNHFDKSISYFSTNIMLYVNGFSIWFKESKFAMKFGISSQQDIREIEQFHLL